MRTIITTIFLVTTALAGDTNKFQLFQILNNANDTRTIITTNNGKAIVVHVLSQPVLEPSKASLITNGITLGQVVSNLGLGWQEGGESVGLVHWSFADGLDLIVWPSRYTADEVISTNETARCRFWFAPIRTNGMFGFSSRSRSSNQLSAINQAVSTRTYKIQFDTFFISLKKTIAPMEGEWDMELLGRYFQEKHVDIDHPKFVMFMNDRLGMLLVRATPADLDKIGQLVSDIINSK